MKKVVPFTKTITFRTMIAEITDIEVKHTLSLSDNNEIQGDILVEGKYKMTDASQIEEEFHYKLPFTIDIDDKYELSNLDITISDFYFEIINEEDLKINAEIELNGIEEKKFQEEVTNLTLSLEEEILETEPKEEVGILSRERGEEDENSKMIPIEIEDSSIKIETVPDYKNPLDLLAAEIEMDIKKENNITENINSQSNHPVKELPKEQNQDITSDVSSIFSSFTNTAETFSTYYVYIVRESDTLESIIEKYKTTKEEIQNYNDLAEVKVGSKLIIPCANNE